VTRHPLAAAADLIGKELTGPAYQTFADLMESAGIWEEETADTDLDDPAPPLDLAAAEERYRVAKEGHAHHLTAKAWADVVRLRRAAS
jgi:hypothetical protein